MEFNIFELKITKKGNHKCQKKLFHTQCYNYVTGAFKVEVLIKNYTENVHNLSMTVFVFKKLDIH